MKKLKDLYNRIPDILKNRYFIVSLFFLIWITFIDENNLILLNKKLNNLEEIEIEIDSLKNEIKETEIKLNRLNNSPEELERFARENFLMKKEQEDIILIREN